VVVASDPDVAETSALQYEKQLMLAVVLDLLGMDFFLKQLPILPKPGSDLAGGDLLQGVRHNGYPQPASGGGASRRYLLF
jgi:hypothetical protein